MSLLREFKVSIQHRTNPPQGSWRTSSKMHIRRWPPPSRRCKMKVRDYMRISEKTDQLKPKRPIDLNFKLMPILGLAGEIGSLLAELKKRVREPQREEDFGNKWI